MIPEVASEVVEVSAESNSTYPAVAWKNSTVTTPRRAETAQIEANHAGSNHAARDTSPFLQSRVNVKITISETAVSKGCFKISRRV
jgi:hypothetical protein